MQALWLYEGINGKLEQGNTARPHICAPQNYPIREIWWRLPQALPALPPPGILALYTRCPHQRGSGFTVRDSFVGVFDDCLGFVPIMGVSPVVTVTR